MSKMADSISPKEAHLNLETSTGVIATSDMRLRVRMLSRNLSRIRAYKLRDIPSRIDICKNNSNEGYFSLQLNA